MGIRRTNYTVQSSIPCTSYSISWGIAAVHQAAYGARYGVLLRSRRLSTTSCAPRHYGASESEVVLARMTYGIDRGSYHVFYHTAPKLPHRGAPDACDTSQYAPV